MTRNRTHALAIVTLATSLAAGNNVNFNVDETEALEPVGHYSVRYNVSGAPDYAIAVRYNESNVLANVYCAGEQTGWVDVTNVNADDALWDITSRI